MTKKKFTMFICDLKKGIWVKALKREKINEWVLKKQNKIKKEKRLPERDIYYSKFIYFGKSSQI